MTTKTLPARRKIDVEAYHRMAAVGILGANERVELIDDRSFGWCRSAASTPA